MCDQLSEWPKWPEWMSKGRVSEIEGPESAHEFNSFRKWLDKTGYVFEENTDSTYGGQTWSKDEVPYETRDLWDVFRTLVPRTDTEKQEPVDEAPPLCLKCRGTGNKSLGILPFMLCDCGCRGPKKDPRDIL